MAPFPPLHDLLSNTAAATALHATRTLHQRQTQTTTPAATTVTVVTDGSNNNDSPDDAQTLSGGAIAGIVIGSIAGFLLLVWIIRSCTNLGAPPGDEAVPGRPWYGGVRDEYPPRHIGRGRDRSRGRSRHSHRHHHGHSRSRSYGGSRRVSVVEPVPVQEVAPVVVRENRRSRSRGYYGYGEEPVRSRSRGRY